MGREQQDAVADDQSLLDGVGDEQQREVHVAPQLQQLFLHLAAGQRIQRGERLVHQQDLRLHGQRAGDRHAGLHAAGEGVRVGIREAAQADLVDVQQRPCLGLGPGDGARGQQRKHHVLLDRLPRQQLVELLEHHDAVGARAVDALAGQAHFALLGVQEAGRCLEQRGFAAARWAEEDESVTRIDGETHLVRGPHASLGGTVFEADTIDFQQGGGRGGT